ncbi:hypothetical protein [Okeania hirsuta]|uniref:hypothetical protein n=1 Tax=Okeania hirsuta TaxID=1458930 RepID=UPI002696D782
MLTNWKKQDDLGFLSEVSCVPLQQSLRHLQTAFTNFFSGRAKTLTLRKSAMVVILSSQSPHLSGKMVKYI